MKITEASTGGVLWKKGVPEKFTNFTEKTRRWGLLLIKCHPVWPTALLKRDSSTVGFLWIFENFQGHWFWSRDLRKWNLCMIFSEWSDTLLTGKSKEGILV